MEEISRLTLVQKEQEIAMMKNISNKDKEKAIGCIYKNIALNVQVTIKR